MKHQVPVRTFADWDEVEPGFFEADLVAHCGTSVEGSFLWSFVLTDIVTGWTECLALRHRGQDTVIGGLERVRKLLPFPLLGFDTDNGGEFLNYAVLAYCEKEQITFTRGRAYKKNDQCHIEQKNGSIVRQIVGYDRFEGEIAYRQLSELYRAVRLYVNFFQPSMKLLGKQRHGSRMFRNYDAAQTPFQRLIVSKLLDDAREQHLTKIYHTLDPVRLLQQIRALQDELWQHAVLPQQMPAEVSGKSSASPYVPFDLQACLPGSDHDDTKFTATNPLNKAPEVLKKRKYHRKSNQPRSYRTREDPLEDVKDELYDWFLAAPNSTGKALLRKLQQTYPDRFSDSLLRTVQRRLQA